MKKLLSTLAAVMLTGCAGELSSLGQQLHGSRVAAESNESICLNYLAGGRKLSNIVREEEIKNRQINCAVLVSPREIEIERRLRRAEDAAEQAKEDARKAKRDASDAAASANNAATRRTFCSQGLKSFC